MNNKNNNFLNDVIESFLTFPLSVDAHVQHNEKVPDWSLATGTVGYPVYDQFVDNDGSLVFEFALAGFQKSGLNVATHVQTRMLSVEGSCKHDEKLVGRRIARRTFVKKFVVDTSRFDLSKVTSSFVDGLLSVKVPLHKTPPTNDQVKVQIF